MENYNNMPEADEMALWRRKSKNGKEYLSGIVKINGKSIKVVAFVNKKTKDTQPDYSFKKPDQTKQVRKAVQEQDRNQQNINNFDQNNNSPF
jgi:hypothetical protein